MLNQLADAEMIACGPLTNRELVVPA